MMFRTDAPRRWARWIGRAAVLLGFAAVVVLLMLWLAGRFERKVPIPAAVAPAQQPLIAGRVAPVRLVRIPLVESAVGTIRAVHETSVGAKILARVVEIHLKAGQKVHSGDLLVRLDDTDLRAKLEEAQAAVTSAEALSAQAAADEKRAAELVKTQSVSRQQYERSLTELRTAEANLRGARENVKAAQAALDWATVRSPLDGVVIDKKVDLGDMVTPGQVLVTLFDPTRMQLIASVRESLAQRLQVGQDIAVRLDGLQKQCSGTISEIVPEAQSASRSFQVKVTGPCPAGIYTGMFGRLLIPLEEEQIVVIPRQAVQHVGQLELVDVLDGGQAKRRAIRTGRIIDEDVEVLSGLHPGEQVVIPAPPSGRAGPQEASRG